MAEELGAYLAGRSHDRDDLVFTAPRGGPLRESKFVSDRFKPAIGATNQALAQLDPDGRPELLPEALRLCRGPDAPAAPQGSLRGRWRVGGHAW